MFRVKNNTILEAYKDKFEIVYHHYPTRHSKNSYIKPKICVKATNMQYLHVDNVSAIPLLIKMKRQLLQPQFLKENLKIT